MCMQDNTQQNRFQMSKDISATRLKWDQNGLSHTAY